MYICVCHAITDRQIREIVEQGATSLIEVQQRLPIASCCGRCESTACDVIEEQCAASSRRAAA